MQPDTGHGVRYVSAGRHVDGSEDPPRCSNTFPATRLPPFEGLFLAGSRPASLRYLALLLFVPPGSHQGDSHRDGRSATPDESGLTNDFARCLETGPVTPHPAFPPCVPQRAPKRVRRHPAALRCPPLADRVAPPTVARAVLDLDRSHTFRRGWTRDRETPAEPSQAPWSSSRSPASPPRLAPLPHPGGSLHDPRVALDRTSEEMLPQVAPSPRCPGPAGCHRSRRRPVDRNSMTTGHAVPVSFRAFIHRRVRGAVSPFPVIRRPFLPWALSPSEVTSSSLPNRSPVPTIPPRSRRSRTEVRHVARRRLSDGSLASRRMPTSVGFLTSKSS